MLFSLSLCKNLKLGFFLFFLLFYFLLFPLPCSAASWTAEERAGWQYHQKLTFNNKDQAENLTDFPVLIKLNPTRFNYSQAKDQGEDIRFLDSDDQTLLSYEIEKWTKDGESFIWVKVPQIDASSQTDSIYMYWGNPKAATSQNPAQVWDGNFKLVQHLKETSGQHLDSTSNNNNSTSVDVTTQGSAVGKINGADQFNGTSNYIIDPDISLTGSLTVSAWVKSNSSGNSQDIIYKQGSTLWRYNYVLRINGCVVYGNVQGSVNEWIAVSGQTCFDSSNWHHVVLVWNGSSSYVYLDGNLDGTTNVVSQSLLTGTQGVRIGRDEYTGTPRFFFNGIIDEARISNTTRSSAWISAEYKTMNDEFITFGSDKGPSLKIGELSSLFDRYALTDNGMPSFIFSRFTDNTYPLHKYFLEVDGTTFIDFIPPNPKDKNNDNIVNENEKDFEDDDKYVYYTDDFLTVRPKKKVLSDGPHSWQAIAVNSAGNTQSTSVNYLLVNTHQCNFSKEFFPLVLNGISGIGSNLNYNWRDADYSQTKTYTFSGRFVNRPYSLDNPLFSLWGIAPSATQIRLTLKDQTTGQQVFRGSTTTGPDSQWGINIDQALTPDSSYTAILESANDKGDYIQLPEFKLVVNRLMFLQT